MVLETLMKLCVTNPDFLEKLFLSQKLGKWAKNRVFCIWEKLIPEIHVFFISNFSMSNSRLKLVNKSSKS